MPPVFPVNLFTGVLVLPPAPAAPIAGTYSKEPSVFLFFSKYTFSPIAFAPLAVIFIVPLFVTVPVQ